MTYRYHRSTRHEPRYRVRDRGIDGSLIGECWRVEPLTGRTCWRARLTTDPLVIGEGATRDEAVDDAYRQVGGPG